MMLRNRSIAALLAAEVISRLGTQMTWLALPWFVLVTTGSPTRMGIVYVAEVLPVAALGLLSGTIVHRFGARQTMVVCDLARAPLLALVPTLHALDALSFPLLLVLVVLMGSFSTPYFSSQRLILPEIVGENEQVVAQANSLIEGANRLATLAGPAAGGVLIALVGATNVLWIDAASYLVSVALLLSFVSSSGRAPDAEEARGIFAGIRFLLRDRLLGRTALAILLYGLFFPMLFASLPVLAYVRYDQSPQIAGWLIAAWGGGAALGSVLAFRLVTRTQPLRLASAAIVAVVAPLWLLVFQLPAAGVGAVLFVSAVAIPLVNAPVLGLITVRVPGALRPKVMTALITFEPLAQIAGYSAAGPILDGLGLATAYVIVGAGTTLASAVFLSASLREGRVATRVVEEAA